MDGDFTETGLSKIQSFAFVIAVCLCAVFSVFFLFSDFAAADADCGVDLQGRINPNDAPAASLVRLPGIGIGRAAAIVAYRERFGDTVNRGVVFQSCDDLQKVKGIGPKTAAKLCQWLKFDGECEDI